MSNAPDRFNAYWDEIDRELLKYPANPELEEMPMRSTHFCTVYWVKLTSVGPYRIGGYLSIPNGGGPFPTVMQVPRYGSVNHVPDYNDRKRYVLFTLMHRGQRLVDKPWAAAYPGLLTEGISDPGSYIYRAILADCIRGAEFIQNRPEVDRNRLAVSGDDKALIAASRRPNFSHAQISGLLFYKLMEARKGSSAYPIEEINDYLRGYPEHERLVEETLSFFDPIHHVRSITAKTFLSVGDDGAVGGPEWLQPLIDSMGGEVKPYRVTHRGGIDNDATDAWLATEFGVQAMSRFRRTMP